MTVDILLMLCMKPFWVLPEGQTARALRAPGVSLAMEF